MAYIYKITNIINNKSYIGQTTLSIEHRWKEHLECLHKPECIDRPLYRAFVKYGIENFKIEQIEECSDEELNEREIFWIEYYDTFNSGYNLTIGGDGNRHYKKEDVLKLWNEGKTITEISKELHCYRNGVALILDYYNIPIEERKQRGYYKQGKAVYQLDKNTEEIITSYPSIADAARAVGAKNPQHTNGISGVCNKKRGTAYGYKWRWVE